MFETDFDYLTRTPQYVTIGGVAYREPRSLTLRATPRGEAWYDAQGFWAYDSAQVRQRLIELQIPIPF